MKINRLIPLFLIGIFASSFSFPSHAQISQRQMTLDTITGSFLYELNVAQKCYTRFDQVEQGNNLLTFKEKRSTVDLSKIYNRGVYFLNYEPVISDYLRNQNVFFFQNKIAIAKFIDAVIFFKHHDKQYLRNVVRDKLGILLYKRVYATFVVADLGKQLQLVPGMKKYECCYSNQKEQLQTFFIIDVLKFRVM